MGIARSEVYFVDLGPADGNEMAFLHPVVVVSVRDVNDNPFVIVTVPGIEQDQQTVEKGLVVTVVPGTSYKPGKRIFKHQVRVEPSRENGLELPTVFKCTQIKALDYRRFNTNPCGKLSPSDLLKIEEALRKCLGLI
jgi:mRNA interferase MazF